MIERVTGWVVLIWWWDGWEEMLVWFVCVCVWVRVCGKARLMWLVSFSKVFGRWIIISVEWVSRMDLLVEWKNGYGVSPNIFFALTQPLSLYLFSWVDAADDDDKANELKSNKISRKRERESERVGFGLWWFDTLMFFLLVACCLDFWMMIRWAKKIHKVCVSLL